MTLLVVQNSAGSPIGRLAGWWDEVDLPRRIVRAYDGEPIPDPDDYAGVVLLGGGLMPDEDDRAPWLAHEREVAERCIDTGLPLLGICLGGQLLAHVAGGEVRARFGTPESGATELTRTDAAEGDPLFGPLPERFTAIQHHVDQITALPRDAVLLARSTACPIQSFRVGASAWGVQFHPEVDATRLRTWQPESFVRAGLDPAEALAAADAAEPEAGERWRAFAHRFARVATSGTSA